MIDINYSDWADYIEEIFKIYNLEPELIADLGCGTGSFCLEMADRGYNMIGVDISTEMLSRAMLKLESQGVEKEKVLFLNQDMSRFELYGTVDIIVSLIDSINYITNRRELRSIISLVENYLNPGGLFIFDINSLYKFKEILSNNIFYSIDDEITYIWKNTFNRETKLCKFDLTFFVREENYYKRFDEVHFERAYTEDELSEIIKHSGLELLEVYDGLSFRSPSKNSERLFFICKKHK